jgi:CHAT domain-containing protein/Flp pilus assembly protein TadD
MKYFSTTLLLFSISTYSFSQNWEKLYDSTGIYSKKGDYKKALPVAQKTVLAAKKEFGETGENYALSLNRLGTVYDDMNDYAKAAPFYIGAIGIMKNVLGEDHPVYASMLNNLGLLYYKMGEYANAELAYLQSTAIRKKVLGEEDPSYAISLNNLAALYNIMGQYPKAEPLYLEAKKILKKINGEENPDYAMSLNNLAQLYESMGRYEMAEPLFIQANQIRKKILGEMHPDYAASQNNLGLLYYYTGQYNKAETFLIQAKDTWKKVSGEMHPDYAIGLNNLAILYKDMGLYEKAEPLLLQSKEIRGKVLGELHPDYANTLNSLALLYLSMGQFEKAGALFIQTKDILKKVSGEEHPNYATCLNSLAVLYETTGQYSKAEPIYLEANEIFKRSLGQEHPDYAMGLDNLALLYDKTGQYEKSEPLHILSMEIRKKVLGTEHPDYAGSLNNLAFLYTRIGRYDKAEPLFIQSLATWKKVVGNKHPNYISNLSNLAGLYEDMGQYDKAEPLLLESSRIITENLKNTFTILSEKEKGNYLKNNTDVIETNNSFFYNNRKASPAMLSNNFNQQLFYKSLTLADTRNMLSSVQQSRDTTVQRLFKDWQTYKGILAKQYALPLAERRSNLKLLETQSENVEKELTRRSAAFSNQQKAINISLQDVQQNLQPDEVAIEFVSFQLYRRGWKDSTVYAAYILQKNNPVPVFIPLFEEKQLQKVFDKATALALNADKDEREAVRVDSLYGDKDLYKLVWQPLEPYLTGIKKIAYSPAGKLYGIAFHALRTNDATLLMDKYQLQQYTSTRQVALRQAVDQLTKPAGITLFGNASFSLDSLQLEKQKKKQPGNETATVSIFTAQSRSSDQTAWVNLPGTDKEVKAIQQLFEQHTIANKLFTETTATEENLKALDGRSPQIIHLATHGFFLPAPDKKKKEADVSPGNTYTLADDPLIRSGLILAGANYAWSGKTPIRGVEDGIATAYEIAQLNLSNTELVVLSACESALGDVKGSEGVFGLQRSFKIAGVKKMIVSLWQVPDKETAELMTSFYGYWMNGKGIDESFRQAQADMRKKNEDDIYYWAAFVLVE